ncbi:MAG: putative Ig domain-containing protein [Planctomycetota bacterium]
MVRTRRNGLVALGLLSWLVVLCGSLATAQAPLALPFTDDFQNGVLNPNWTVSGCGTVVETAGELHLQRNCGSAGSVIYAMNPSIQFLSGDFDVQVHYNDPTQVMEQWTSLNLLRVSNSSIFATMECFTRYAAVWINEYKAWVGSPAGSVIERTCDSSGWLRILRSGSRVRWYALSDAPNPLASSCLTRGWVLLRDEIVDDSDVYVQLYTGTTSATTAYTARFDDLRITSPAFGACVGEFTEEFAAPQSDPALYSWPSTGCHTTYQQNGRLILDHGNCTSGPWWQQRVTNSVLCGDFDIRIDFEILGAPFPATGGRWTALRLYNALDRVVVATLERTDSSGLPAGWGGHSIYKAFLYSEYEDQLSRIAPTDDLSGTMRFRRQGSRLGWYFLGDDGEWVLLRSQNVTSEPLFFHVDSGTDVSTAPYQIAWDNLIVQDAVSGKVQWAADDGGNGHYYEVVVVPGGVRFLDAAQLAHAAGGYLATVTSPDENAFVARLTRETPASWFYSADEPGLGAGNSLVGYSPDGHGPFLGGLQRGAGTGSFCSEPAGDWHWVTGESWGYTAWAPGRPDDNDYSAAQFNDNRLHYFGQGARLGTSTWNDVPDDWWFYANGANPLKLAAYVVEWDRLPDDSEPPLQVHLMPGYPNAPFTDPGERKLVRPGVETMIWGSANHGDGSALGATYTFEILPNPDVTTFTDGSLTGIVVDDRLIHEFVTFELAPGVASSFVTVTLTVEVPGGGIDSALVELFVVSNSDPLSDTPLEAQRIDAEIAIEDALRYLYQKQLANGSWGGSVELSGAFNSHPVGVTAVAVWAFANQGHTPGLNPDESIYGRTVEQALEYLLARGQIAGTTGGGASVANLFRGASANGVSDLNENCQSVFIDGRFGDPLGYYYETALVAAALCATGRPLDRVPAGPLVGMTYHEVVEDIIDWFGVAQKTGGGWRYQANGPTQDMSVSSWFYLAMEAAENVFHIPVPDWIKQEAEDFMNTAQGLSVGSAGGYPFGYDYFFPASCQFYALPCTHGFGTTAGGLSGLVLVESEGPFVVPGARLALAAPPLDGIANKRNRALLFLGEHWNLSVLPQPPGSSALYGVTGNLGNTYAMVSVARALRLTAWSQGLPPGQNILLTNNGTQFDWETGEVIPTGAISPPGSATEGYVPYLVRTQLDAGAPADRGHWEFEHYGDELNTAFAVLTLDPVVFRFYGNLPPVSHPGGPYFVECVGSNTEIQLNGILSYDPEEAPITYQWSTGVPGVTIVAPTTVDPTIVIDPAVSGFQPIRIALTVDDGEHTTTEWVDIEIADRRPPSLATTIDENVIPSGTLVRAEANDDGAVNIADPVYTLAYLFNGGPMTCLQASDSNNDGAVNIADPVYTLAYLFNGGAVPAFPFPDCGTIELTIGCDLYLSCPGEPPVSAGTIEVEVSAIDSCNPLTTHAEIETACGTVSIDPGTSIELDCEAGTCAVLDQGALVVIDAASAILRVTATDDRGWESSQSLELCTDNTAPVITSEPPTLAEPNVLYEYAVVVDDPDVNVLTFQLLAGPPGLSLDPVTGVVQWTPTALQQFEKIVEVRVTDGLGGEATQRFGVRPYATPIYNLPPVIVESAPLSAAEGQTYSFNAAATDPNDDVLEYSLAVAPAGMVINPGNGVILWTPAADQNGPRTVSLTVRDPLGLTDTFTWVIAVADLINTAPVFTSTPVTTTAEGDYYAYLPVVYDGDGDSLMWTLDEAPEGMLFTPTSGLVQWEPSASDAGTYAIAIRVADGRGGVVTQAYTLVVAEALDGGPVFTSTPVLGATEGMLYQYAALAVDDGGTPVTYSVVSGPPGLTIDPDTGFVSWTPGADQSGFRQVSLVATDQGGLVGPPQTYQIDVAEALNAPPVIVSIPVPNAEFGDPYAYAVVVEDTDSIAFTYAILEGPVGASISAAGVFEWTPSVAGVFPVTLRVTDDGGLTDTQFFALSVHETLDITPPVLTVTATPSIVSVGDPVSITVMVTDVSPLSSLTAEVNGAPLALAPDGTATFVPSLPGLFVVTVIAMDAGALTTTRRAEFRASTVTDNGPPTVAWSSPATQSVIDGPIDVIGTAHDADLVFYELQVSVDGGGTFIPLRRGLTPVVSGVLGTIVPGEFLTGTYLFRLCAEDSWGNVACTSPVELDLGPANPAPGFHRFTLLDGFVEVAGIPLAVRRTYDVRQRRPGDFGHNWSLEASGARLEQTRAMGADWIQSIDTTDPLVPVYGLTSNVPHRVTVHLPDGSVHRFEMVPYPQQQALFPIEVVDFVEFVPYPGTHSQLSTNSDPSFVQPASPGPVELVDGSFQVYSPSSYTLTLRDGRRLIFTRDPASGEYPLVRVTEPNGNFVDIGPAGLVHSSGASMSLARDPEGRVTSLSTPAGSTRTYSYDSVGDLISATDFEGYTTQYVYDDRHRLVQIVDPRGFTPGTLLYDEVGRLTGVVDSNGNTISLALNEVVNQHVVTDRLGNTSVISYDSRGNVVSVLDADLHETTFTYDAEDRLLSKTNPLGHTESYEYDATGLLTQYTDPLGGTIAYTYDAGGRPLTVTDKIGRTTTYEYDTFGNRTAFVSPGGGRAEWTYDTDGNVIEAVDAVGGTSTWDRDPFNPRLVTFTDSIGRVALFETNQRGQVILEAYLKDGELAAYSYEIDENGLTRSSTLPSGATGSLILGAGGYPAFAVDYSGARQAITFDAAGDVSAITGVGTPVTLFERDAERRVVRVENPEGTAIQRLLDTAGRPTHLETPSGRTVAATYDAAGRTLSETLSGSAPITYVYDALGRVTSSATDHDTLGTVTRTYEYDAASQLTAEVNELGERTEYVHDLEGRITSVTFPDLTSAITTYDLAGRPTSFTNELGQTLSYAYSVGGLLLSVTDSVTPSPGVTSYTYNDLGGLESATTPGGSVWTVESDPVGRISAQSYPWGGTISWHRDGTGRALAVDMPTGQTIFRDYDEAGRLTAVQPGLDSPEVFNYDDAGNLTAVMDGTGLTTYTRAPNGAVGRIDYSSGDFVEYQYDVHGRVVALVTPGGATNYQYDAQSRLAVADDTAVGTTSYHYDAVGRLARIQHPDGSETVYQRDSRGRVTRLVTTNALATVIRDENYTYDLAGNPISASGLSESVLYTYDSASRVTAESWTGASAIGTQTYAYDTDWNPTMMGSRTLTYDGAQRLTSDGEFTSYTYDLAGRPVERWNSSTTELFAYDVYGRLSQVTRTDTSGTIVIELEYDFLDLLRAIRVDGVLDRTFLWETEVGSVPRLLEERDGSGSLCRRYVHGLRPVAIDSVTDVVLHQDPLGSTRVVTDMVGTVLETNTFSAYGDGATPLGSASSLLFAGELYLPELDLYFLRTRFYDPTAGRFLTPDTEPVAPELPTSFAPFLYAAANPVRFTDPLGTRSFGELNAVLSIAGQLARIALPNLPLPVSLITEALIGNTSRFVGASGVGVSMSIGVGASRGIASATAGLSLAYKRGREYHLLELGLQAGVGFAARDPKTKRSVSIEGGIIMGQSTGNPEFPNSSPGAGVSLVLGGSYARQSTLTQAVGPLERNLNADVTTKKAAYVRLSVPLFSDCQPTWCEAFTVSGGFLTESWRTLWPSSSAPPLLPPQTRSQWSTESGPDIFGFSVSMTLFWVTFGDPKYRRFGGIWDYTLAP